MEISFYNFGIARDIVGERKKEIEIPDGSTVAEFKHVLVEQYPELADLAHYSVAVNDEYASDDQMLKIYDEIALLPPVSGG